MLAKHNAKGCNRPYRQPRGSIPVGAAEASADAPVSTAPPLPSPSSPAAAERAEPTDVTGTTVVEEPAAKRVKFADADTSAEQEDTGSADAAAIPVPCEAPEQQMRSALSDVFAPFLASLDLAEMAAAELLRNERAHWESRAEALASAHADELRRVREECDASMTALSAELVEARHQLVGREDQATVEELQTQLAQAKERLKAAEQVVVSALHKSTAAATTLSAVRDAAAAALRRLEA